MLTAVEYDRLPSLLQNIVDADRQIATCMKPTVVMLDEARVIRGKLQHRRDLTKSAHHVFGNELKGSDGTARK